MRQRLLRRKGITGSFTAEEYSGYQLAKSFRELRITTYRIFKDVLLITLGVLSASVGLKSFLIPNGFIDGGAMGVFLTGLILAMARGAGEVAPLMITGVVKLAPNLPLDGTFPFFHLDRKFMHLGFHIYDVGFQSPNVEAAKPMVFTTTLLLLAVVVALNLAAILIRDKIRKKYRTGAFA
jgi:uncharacterized membrane-anchored protein YitT (DUF2179 family)